MGFGGSDLLVLVAGIVTLFGPGMAVLWASGPGRRRQPVTVVGAAPVVTAGVIYLAALASGLLGVAFGPVPVVVVTVLVAALSWGVGRRFGREVAVAPVDDDGTAVWSRWVGVATTALAAVIALRSWGRGLGALTTVPQEHDTITHTLLVSRIARTGQAAPWAAWPADVLTGSHDGYYPAGFHSIAALIADFGTSAVTAVNAMMVVTFAVAMPIGVFALGSRLSWRGLAPVIGGAAALVAVLSYRPLFAFMHDGGILANGAAIAVAPAALTLLVTSRGRWADVTPLALAIAGAVAIHPTAAAVIGLTTVVWVGGNLLTESDARAALRPWIATVVPAGVIGALLLGPVAVASSEVAGDVTAWPRDFGPAPFHQAAGFAVGMPYGGYLDYFLQSSQVRLAVLVLAGVAVCLVTRRHGGLLAAWLTWTAVTVVFIRGWDVPLVSTLTNLFYNSFVRISGAMAIPQWLMGGVAIGAVVHGVRLLLDRASRDTSIHRGWTVAGAGALVIAALLVLTIEYPRTNGEALQHRYRYSDFVRVDDEDRAAFQFLADHLEPGQRVMNNANDGSTYAYVYDGIPIIETNAMGTASAMYTVDLLRFFDDIDENPRIRELVRELNIAYVIADAEAPAVGIVPDAREWVTDEAYSIPPGFFDLDGSASLRRVFTAGSVAVFEVDPALLNAP